MVGNEQMDLDSALAHIRLIPDYPSPGILFQDITPLLASPQAFSTVISALATTSTGVDVVAGVEARGFIIGAPIAHALALGFVPIRKRGKLPHTTISRKYGLEYGSDEIEVHSDAFTAGARVLLIDDVLATGGTLLAAIELIHEAGAIVTDIALISEISVLGGRSLISEKYPEIRIHTLIA